MKIKDGDWTLFDCDLKTGRTVWKRTNPDGSFTLRTDYPVDKIVKDNREFLNDSTGQRWGEGRRIASIPLNLFHDQLAPAIEQDDEKHVSRWLNDGDNAAFRTFGGRV